MAVLALAAASPPPSPAPVDLTKAQAKIPLPKTALHTEYVVATNKLGQVTHVLSGKISKDAAFNGQTYGNALQAFIRTTDGKAVSGTYRLTYDYNPSTQLVRRDVALLKAGGVNPDDQGAAVKMIEDAQKHAPKKSPAPLTGPTVNPKSLPDLPQVMNSPH